MIRRHKLTRLCEKGWHCEVGVMNGLEIRKVLAFLEYRLMLLDDRFSGGNWSSSNNSMMPPDLRHYLTGEFDLQTRMDSCLTDFMSSPQFLEFMRDVLETDHCYIHYPPMARFKRSDTTRNIVPIHQDAAYNRHLTDFVTIWVPLVEITEECGGVVVYEGSQNLPLILHEAQGAWAHGAVVDRAATAAAYRKHHVLMQAGDALLFEPTLLHESAPHRDVDHVRYSVDFRVVFDTRDTTKSYYDPLTRDVVRRGER